MEKIRKIRSVRSPSAGAFEKKQPTSLGSDTF